MDNGMKEVRRILLGQLMWTENGQLAAAQSGHHMRFQGLVNGWGFVRFLGVTHRERNYQMQSKTSAEEVRNLLSRMGQAVELRETPQVSACLCRIFMTSPVLVAVETEGTRLRVTAFTGRYPLAPLLCRWELNSFEKGLPETAVPVMEEKTRRFPRGTKSGEKMAAPQKSTKTTGKRLKQGKCTNRNVRKSGKRLK